MDTNLTPEDVLDIANNDKVILIEPNNRDEILNNILISTGLGQYKNQVNFYLVFYETFRDGIFRNGHWVGMIIDNRNKTILWFDSLGIFPDDELQFIKGNFKRVSGQNDRYFGKFLYGMSLLGYTINYNNLQIQEDKKTVSTCGRYVGYFFRLYKEKKIKTPEEFIIKLVNNLKEKNDNLDKVIVRITNKFIKN